MSVDVQVKIQSKAFPIRSHNLRTEHTRLEMMEKMQKM